NAPVTFDGGTGHNSLIIDDSADPLPQTVLLTNLSISSSTVSPARNWYVFYSETSLDSLSITTGGTPTKVNVWSTSVPTIIDGWAGHDTVNVGLSGSTQLIQSPLWIENSHSLSKVIVDDSNENANQTPFFGKVFGTTFGTITGLSPAPINYQYGQTSYVTVEL